jgi:predicted RND superfamily exporter protein
MTNKEQQTKTEAFFYAVTQRYKLILVASILLIVGAAAFLPSMTKDTSTEAFIPKDDPVLLYRDNVRETFGLKDPMVIAVYNEAGIYNTQTLALIHVLGEQLKSIAGIDPDQITSLATENNITGTADGMMVEPFYEIETLNELVAESVRTAIADFDLYRGSLVSEDGTMALVVAEILDSHDAKGHEVYKSVLEMAEQTNRSSEQLYVAGEGAVSGYMASYIDADAQRLNPIAGLVITLILFIAFRTLRGAVIPNIMVLATVGSALGAMAAFGVSFFVITNALPVILIAIGVADGIHIMGQYYEEVAHNPTSSQQALIIRTMSNMWRPVTITSLTTIAGFLAISYTSYMPPMTYFGIFAALGVAIALIYALFFIPSALMMLKPQVSKPMQDSLKSDAFGRITNGLGKLVIVSPKGVLAVAAAVIGIAIYGATKINVNESRITNFKDSEAIYIADEMINANTEGTTYLDIKIQTKDIEGLFDPEALRKIEALQSHMETHPLVNGSTSIVDFIKKMNKSLNENDVAAYKIPDDPFLIAQYFLIYSTGGDPTDFDNYVDFDYRLANVRFRMNKSEYVDEKEVLEAAQEYITAHFTDDTITAHLSGKVALDYQWINQLASNHLKGVLLALFAVFLVAAISFRSIGAGFYTIIPVVIAVIIIYAVMGYAGIWLSVGTSMFAAIAIGVGVDFAVHTVDRMIYFINELKMDIDSAFASFFKTTGRALLFNLLSLSLGFGVLTTSSVPPLISFGALVAVSVSAGFLASITVLPAIIYLMKPAFLSIQTKQDRMASKPTNEPSEMAMEA